MRYVCSFPTDICVNNRYCIESLMQLAMAKMISVSFYELSVRLNVYTKGKYLSVSLQHGFSGAEYDMMQWCLLPNIHMAEKVSH